MRRHQESQCISLRITLCPLRLCGERTNVNIIVSTRNKHLLHCIVIVVLTGIGSRVFHTGIPLFDKYLGDALYAILFYLLLCLFWEKGTPLVKASLTMLLMLAIESFQLTHIPLRFHLSSNIGLQFLAVVLGTTFSWQDILAYIVGILIFALLEQYLCPMKSCQTV